MTERVVSTEQDRAMLIALIKAQKLPFTASVLKGKHRTLAQNRLQRQWMLEIAEQLGDRTPEEARGECKLTLGVPILRAENPAFREAYDEHIRPLPYERKLAYMMMPLDFPVTRLMTTSQKTKYLDQVAQHFAEQGVVLTDPEARKAAA